MSRRVRIAVALAAMSLALAGCQPGELKTPKVLPEWSRGTQLGIAALNRPIDILAQDDSVQLVWIDAEQNVPHYARLDTSGELRANVDVGVPSAHPEDARLLGNSDGSLIVLWTDNPAIPRALFGARIDSEGQLLAESQMLSPEGVRVAEFSVVDDRRGIHHVFWTDDIPTEGGLHHLAIADDGELLSGSTLLVEGGQSPSARLANDGSLHLSWVVEPETRVNYVFHATFDPVSGTLGPATQVALYKTATGLIAYPPVLALEDGDVYLFWALEQRGGGMTPGEAQAYYVSFPVSSPRAVEPRQLDVPPIARPEYKEVVGELPYERLASPDAAWPTSFLYQPAALGGQRSEVGVFLVAEVATLRQSSKEIVFAVFRDGELRGYHLPTQLGRALRPACAIDSDGDLHLTWLNAGGFGRYEVYYASTSADVKAEYDRVTLQDRAVDVLNAIWALAPALGFFPPVFLLWAFLPALWIVLFYFVKVEGGLERRSSQIALVVGVALYLFSKLFLMPGPLFYAPFQDRLPPNLQFLPVIGMPILTLAVSSGVVLIYLRKRDYRSLFAAFLLFVCTDALLSLIIYVPRWLAG